MEKLHPKSIWIFFFRFIFAGLFFLFIIGSMSVPLLSQVAKGERVFPWLGFLPLILYLVFCYIWARWTYRFWRYEITEDTFKMEHGVIWKRYISIPYERIQNIDIHRGVIARILGLSELRIQTAGYGGAYGKWGAWAEGRLPGIVKERAEELREKLISRVKGTKQGL